MKAAWILIIGTIAAVWLLSLATHVSYTCRTSFEPALFARPDTTTTQCGLEYR